MADGHLTFDTKIDTAGFKSGLSTVASTAGTAMAGVSAALLGAAGYAVKVGGDFESSMSQVAATMGMTSEQIQNGSEDYKKLEAAAKDAGATTKFSATQAADALNYMALAGYDTEKSVATLPTVLNLAAAGGMDLGTASDMVTDSMSALGDAAGTTESFVDKMAKTSQKSNTNVAQLGEAILTVGGTAKNLAGGVDEMNTVLGIFADNGVKGSEGGTALRNVILSLSAPTDTARKKMKDLGLEVFDADGNMRPLNDTFNDLNGILGDMTQGEQTQVLNEIFNKVDLKSVNALLANSGDRFDELSGYIENCDGAAANMAETMNDNLQGDITILQSAMEGLGIAIYQSMDTPLRDAAKAANDYVGQLMEAFDSGGLEGLIDKAGDIFAELAVKAVQQAPKVVDAAVSLIKAFASGIAKHKDEIYKAAIQMAKTLADGLIKFLPKSVQQPVKQAVDAMAESFESGGLRKAIDTVITFFESFVKVVSNLAGKVLPPLVAVLDTVAGHLDVLGPAIVACVTAYGTMKVVKVISDMMAASTGIIATLTAMEEARYLLLSAVNGALSAQQFVVGVLTGKITLATAATAAFNAVMSAMGGPIGLLVIAVTAAVAGFAAYKLATGDVAEATIQVNEELRDQADAVKEAQAAREESVTSIEGEYNTYQNLWDTLQTIVDANGKVKEGEEKHAAFITKQLSDALGVEITIVDGVVQKYDELCGSIDEVIETKRREAIVNTYADSYTEAMAKQNQAIIDVADAEASLDEAKQRQADTQAVLDAAYNGSTDVLDTMGVSLQQVTDANNKALESVENAQENYDNANTALDEYNSTIYNYEDALGAIEAGTADAGLSVFKLSEDFKTAGNASIESLEQQKTDMDAKYASIKQAASMGIKGVTDETVAKYQYMALAARNELDIAGGAAESQLSANEARMAEVLANTDLIDEARDAVDDVAPTEVGTLEEGQAEVADAAQATTETAVTEGVDAADVTTAPTEAANEAVNASADTLAKGKEVIQSSATDTFGAAGTGAEAANLPAKGTSVIQMLVSAAVTSANKNKSKLSASGKGVGANVYSGIRSSDMSGNGAKEVASALTAMINAINSKKGAITSAARAAAQGFSAGFNSANIGSASISTINAALNSVVSAINSRRGAITSAAQSCAGGIVTGFNNARVGSNLSNAARAAADSMVAGINSRRGAAGSAGSSLGNAAYSGARNGLSGGYNIGYNLSAGVASGISSGASLAINAAIRMATRALNAAKSKLAIRSPSRRARKEVGQMYSAGVALGIKDRIKDVEHASAELAESAVQDIAVPDYAALSDIARRGVMSGTSLIGQRVLESTGTSQAVDTGIDYGRMQTAFTEALKQMGLTVTMDGYKVGYISTPYVDRNMSDIEELKRRGC